MSEKSQNTAVHTKEKMRNRYGDNFNHKHDKTHTSFRKHFKTYPKRNTNEEVQNEQLDELKPTGTIRKLKLKKLRKRDSKGQYH